MDGGGGAEAGLPDISLYNIPKRKKIKITINGHKIYEMTVK
jgi:hypothetical protein